MRVRRMWPVALLLAAPALAACGDDSENGSEDTTTSAAPTATTSEASTEVTTDATDATTDATEESAPTSAAPAGLPAACDVIGQDDVSAAFEVEFVQDGVGSGTTSEQDLEWTSDNCTFVAEGLVEVKVKLTGPDDFERGTFQCPQPPDIGAIVEPVDDIVGADKGWWKVSDAPPLEATMRACTATANVDIDLEYQDGVDYPGDPRNQSVVLIEQVLANLSA